METTGISWIELTDAELAALVVALNHLMGCDVAIPDLREFNLLIRSVLAKLVDDNSALEPMDTKVPIEQRARELWEASEASAPWRNAPYPYDELHEDLKADLRRQVDDNSAPE